MISEEKAVARKAAFAARKNVFDTGLDEAANRNLIGQLALYPQAEVISAYMPIRTEVSPIATMTIFHGQGFTIAVPVIVGAGQALEFHRWTPQSEMVSGPFGAAVPKESVVVEPDVLVTPLLAYDREGYRLGYGGGFYDRSFAGLSLRKKIAALGFAFSAQEIAKVPTEPTDFRLDAIVTEAEVLRF